MVRYLLALSGCFLIALASSGCSVRMPAYNSAQGGFFRPGGYIGESVPTTVALGSDAQSDARARAKHQPISVRQ